MKVFLRFRSPVSLFALALAGSLGASTGCTKGSGDTNNSGYLAGDGDQVGNGDEPGDGDGDESGDGDRPVAVEVDGFIHREGGLLVDESGQTVFLKGAAFGNNVWAESNQPPVYHHSEEDFGRLRAMGMNAARFYLNYQLFESDADPFNYSEVGFEWIEQNVEWAKKHGVFLILNMHVPQGGFQSNAEGAALWDEPENQERFIALWKAIAERFKDEPTIAGYDLLNEARTTSSIDQWKDLANRTVAAIREVDQEHLVVIERLLSVGSDFTEDADQNYFLVNDDNALYEFHFYQPFAYTHQFAEWVGLGDGGKYPDEGLIDVSGLTWFDWSHTPTPPSVPAGDSGFTFYESALTTIPDETTAVQAVMMSELNSGKVYFDELIIKEYDSNGDFVRNVLEDPLEDSSALEFWKAGTTGELSTETGCHVGSCIAIDNVDHDSNAKSATHVFVPQAGHQYTIGGYMKGENVSMESRPDPRGSWTQTSRALFRFDYYSGGSEGGGRNKEALAAELDRLTAWGSTNGVPLYLGEFGVIHHCFEGDKGGLTWVEDMLDLIEERDLHFTYHSYHETMFPIYQSDASRQLPQDSDAIPGLVELFKEKLN